jgi:ribonuclease PH
VALALALKKMLDEKVIDRMPLRHLVAGISVGIVRGELLLDLDYSEDSAAETDMNVVQTDRGQFLEVQATAEKEPFSRTSLNALLRLADLGLTEIITIQKEALKKKSLLFMAYG